MASVMRSSVLNVVRSCGRSVCAGARARTATAARAVSVAPVARRAMCTAQDFGTLQEVLEREIELEKQTAPDAVLEELSQRFSEYTVTANPGYGRVFLTKSLAGGEDVQVEIDVQNTVELREDPEEGEEEEEGHGELEEEEENVMEGFPMVITVGHTEGGKQLKFSCVASHELVITSIRMAEPSPDADVDELYQGPSFDDLDLSVQQAFYNYLEEVAGIDDTFSDNVREFCEAKEQVEYCGWLDEVHAFVTHGQ